MDEHSCALRALSLCDGLSVPTLDARRLTDCHCVRLIEAIEAQQQLEVDLVRTARARTVARAGEIQRLMDQRRSWLAEGPPF